MCLKSNNKNIFLRKMAGLYIHIPFCKSRCIYCDFYSTTFPRLQQDYVEALCREMRLRNDYIKSDINTIYLGGGTPSQLSTECLQNIFDTIYNEAFNISNDPEVTMECNPDDITPEYAEAIKHLPINRISIGAQTFNDSRLNFLRRRHTSEQIKNAIDLLRINGFSNISIDLMYGFPKESLNEWIDDINKAISLEVEHISAYSLMYEEGTPLYNMLKSKDINEIDEEISRNMYESLIDMLTAVGYKHYEISNFALRGYQSKHNSSYWKQIPYIGIGASAHSFNINSRQWNVANINEYIRSITTGKIPSEKEILTEAMRYNDSVFTSLRTSEGLDMNKLKERYGERKTCYCLSMAKPHLDNGRLVIINNHMKLTRTGIFVSDDIMSDLMIV